MVNFISEMAKQSDLHYDGVDNDGYPLYSAAFRPLFIEEAPKDFNEINKRHLTLL